MKNGVAPKYLLTLLLVALAAGSRFAAAQTHLIISQVYGGGGNSGAVFTNDFVELYNPTAAAVSVNSYSLQYASTTGNFSAVNTVALSGTVQPGKFFLVQLAAGTNTSLSSLPTPDFASSALNLSGTGGKIALVNGTATLPSGCPAVTTYVDFVGWGSANCSYNDATGANKAPATTNATSLSLNSTNTWTGVNAVDYTAGAPNPRNSGVAGGGGGPTPPPSTVSITDLQGNRSMYVGKQVTTTGVVTSVIYNGYFLQVPSTNPASRTTGVSEAIDVFTSSAPTVHVGDNVTVTGTITFFPDPSASVTPALEMKSVTATTTNSTGAALPAPIVLTSADLTATGGFQQLTRYESMRVTMSLVSTSGTGASGLNATSEPIETYTSNGYFYATLQNTPRPFREPGVDVRDMGASALPSTVTRFDDNPERIYVGTTLMNADPIDVSTGALFNNVTGILDFTFSNDSFYDPSRFIPDAGSLLANYTPGMTVKAMPLPNAGEATVAAFNIERFFNTSSSDDIDYYPVAGKTEKSEAVDITPDAYARRLTKVSLAIRHVLNNPDIVTLEEVENQSVAQDIAAQISKDAVAAGEPDPKYVGYGTDNVTFFTNDEGGISVGFLVKSTTTDFKMLNQFNNNSVFTPTGGNPTTVNDRPPLVLHAGIQRGAGVADYPITVIVNHMKALPDNTLAVQQKKELQAEQLAALIQMFQAKGEHVLAVGDFNDFEFSDGYTDTLGTATNRTVPANQVVTPGMPGLVDPAPTDLVLNLPANERYSYVEDGNAQVLDHVIASADIAGSARVAYAHMDADFPNTMYNDATTPARTSDHDPALAYLAIPAPVTSAMLSGSGTFATPVNVGGTSASGQQLTLTNTGETSISITGFTVTGDFAQSNNCGTSLAPAATCSVNVVFNPTTTGTRTGTITLNGSATVTPVALSGTAVPPGDFTLTDSTSKTTSALTVVAGTSGTVTLNLASVNGFSGPVALSCAGSGTAATGVTCAVTSPVTLAAAGKASATVTVTTTARTQVSGLGIVPSNGMGRAAYLLLAGLTMGALLMVRGNGRKARVGGLLTVLFVLAIGVSGCSDSSKLNTSPNPNGTPNGTFKYTVTATSGSITHTQTINVTVQ